MSPTSRRRRGEPTLDEAAADAGTRFADVAERTRPPARPSPNGSATCRCRGPDPTAPPAPPPDPAVIAKRREERAAEIVKALNPEQARAVTTTEGPLLILAGAGSGKTRVLAHRIAYLVGVKGVPPWRILAVTFTNKAAAELRDRIISLVGEGGRDVQAGTFHALCARVLRRDGEAIGIDRRFVIYDTDDQQALMKQILREEDMPLTGEFRPSVVLGAISRAKNEMLDPTFLAENAANHRERTIARLATRYQERLQTARALDFDDLLLEAVRLFDEAPDVLAKYQDRWRYLHVDEYQDTNRAQYLWVKALATQARQPRGRRRRRPVDLLVARRRPAQHPRLRARLAERHRRQARAQLPLDPAHPRRRPRRRVAQHGAQGQEAVDRDRGRAQDPALRGLQRGGGGRVDRPPGRGPDRRPRHRPDPTRRRGRRDTKFRARDIAVMYRMNAQSRAIEESFLRYGHPLPAHRRDPVLRPARGQGRAGLPARSCAPTRTASASSGSSTSRRARSATRPIEALRAAAAATDPETGEPATTGAPSSAARAATCPRSPRGRGTPWPSSRPSSAGCASRIGVLPLPELLDEVLEASGYRAMLADGSEDGEDRWANLLELRSVTTRYDDLDPEDALDRLLEETALVADQDSYEGDADAVTLITLHAAKGLEFPVVFIAGLEEGLFPHSRALDDERQLEEERRLAYVGHHPREAPAVPVARLAPGDLGDGPGGGPVAVPARDPGRADDRAAARRARRARARPRPRPRVRPAPHDPLQHAGPRPGAGLPAGQRPARRAGRRRTLPAEPRPGRAARGIRGGRAVGHVGTAGESAPAPRRAVRPPRPVIPGERQFRDGDRVRHGRWGDGIVVTSKLTRSDEEITVAFKDPAVGRKTMLASLANLEIVG